MAAPEGGTSREFRGVEAMVIWMGERPLAPGAALLARQAARSAKLQCAAIAYRVDPETLRRVAAEALRRDEIGHVTLTLEESGARWSGGFLLDDPETGETVGSGTFIEAHASDEKLDQAEPVSHNINWELGDVAVAQRASLLGQEPVTLWLTGLSGSGKSTLAQALERRLVELGRPCYRLDGDNLRHGLNRDLGFSPEDRHENIRRVAEVARLMNDAGLIVITAFISPYRRDRAIAKKIIGAERFVEVYLSTDLATCERRDPKGLYAKARRGEIFGFTGIHAPYEAPTKAAVVMDTASLTIAEAAARLLEEARRHAELRARAS